MWWRVLCTHTQDLHSRMTYVCKWREMISVSYHLYCVTVYCFMHQQQQKKALHHHLESLKTPFCCLCRLAHSGTEYKTLCQKYVYDSLNTHKKKCTPTNASNEQSKKRKKKCIWREHGPFLYRHIGVFLSRHTQADLSSSSLYLQSYFHMPSNLLNRLHTSLCIDGPAHRGKYKWMSK